MIMANSNTIYRRSISQAVNSLFNIKSKGVRDRWNFGNQVL
jgi:hypothetical protein